MGLESSEKHETNVSEAFSEGAPSAGQSGSLEPQRVDKSLSSTASFLPEFLFNNLLHLHFGLSGPQGSCMGGGVWLDFLPLILKVKKF